MKAYNLHGINDLRFEEIAEPTCKDGSVIVRVWAAGICGSDLPRIYKTGTYHFPTVPGHEFSGEVCQVGKNVSENWIGKRVGVFPLIPCMKCSCCKNMKYEMCSNYNYLGSRCNGGFAEYVEVPEWNLIEIPGNVSFEQAAMLEPLAVATHAIRQSNVKVGDTVSIIGLGTIGLLITMILKEMGITDFFCIGNKEFQKEKIVEIGLNEDTFINSKESNVNKWIFENTNGAGVDVCFECVGKTETIIQAIESVIPSGTVQLVGNPALEIVIPKDTYWRILRKELKIIGTWNSSFTHSNNDDWNYIIDKMSVGAIHPEMTITHKLSFDELEKGLLVMNTKSEEYIKVMMVK